MEIHPAVEMLPLRTPTLKPATHTNAYFVGQESFVIIDPATPYADEQHLLRERIERRIQKGHQPLAVLLTHHHIDHIGAAAYLQDHFSLPVMAHARTQKRLQQMNYPLRIDRLIDEGDDWTLQWGEKALKLEALFTPGHAPGHLCFIEKNQRFGIVGDMVAGIGSIVIQHPEGSHDPDGHMQDYLNSLERLKSLALIRAFPAHGPMITHPSLTFSTYIAHRLAREQQILACLEDSPCDLPTLRSRVYPDLDIALYTFAEDALRAHLVKLANEDRVSQGISGVYLRH
jgi:endoribonuclease LACTB2